MYMYIVRVHSSLHLCTKSVHREVFLYLLMYLYVFASMCLLPLELKVSKHTQY